MVKSTNINYMDYRQVVHSIMSELQLMMPSSIEESLVVSTHSVATPADDGEDSVLAISTHSIAAPEDDGEDSVLAVLTHSVAAPPDDGEDSVLAVSTHSVAAPAEDRDDSVLAVSMHSVAAPADNGEDSTMPSGLIELRSSATSNLWIFTLKLDASSGLNHRLPNCKSTSHNQ